jgi:hypothetical protein
VRQLTNAWGSPINVWDASYFGYVPEEMWERIQRYQSPVEIPKGMRFDSPEASGIVAERMSLTGSRPTTVWEMNLYLSPKPPKPGSEMDNYIRVVSIMGEETLVRWSWFDAWVRLYIHRAIAWLKTRRHG